MMFLVITLTLIFLALGRQVIIPYLRLCPADELADLAADQLGLKTALVYPVPPRSTTSIQEKSAAWKKMATDILATHPVTPRVLPLILIAALLIFTGLILIHMILSICYFSQELFAPQAHEDKPRS